MAMIDKKLAPNIQAAEPRPGYRLSVTWEDGRKAVVDFSDTIQRGGVFAVLSDEEKFGRVRVNVTRRKIEWPEPTRWGEPEIDIDSESLMVMASQQQKATLFDRIRHAFRSIERTQTETR